MLPREHGAYGQLLFPLATALAIGRPGVAAWCLAAAAAGVFVAHEPLLVLTGQRGARAARELRGGAWRWFAVAASASVCFGVAAVVTMPPAARQALVVPVLGAIVVASFVVAHREHTTAGEMASAVGLSSIALPVSLSAGASLRGSLTCALVFALVFVVATLCVRAMIVWTRHPLGRGTRAGGAAIAVAALAALAWLARSGLAAPIAPWAAAPACLVGFVVAVAAPSPRHVRTIGWLLVGATTLTAAILFVGLRES